MAKHTDVWENRDAEASKAESEERVALKLARRRVTKWHIMLPMILVLSVIGAAGGVFGMYISIATTTATSTESVSLNPQGKATAWAEVDSWLSKGGVPDGRILTWDGIEEYDSGLIGHMFTLASSTGGYQAVVSVDTEGLLATGVSVRPLAPSRVSDAVGLWKNILDRVGGTGATDPMGLSIVKWAGAYLGYSPTDLTVLVGDPNAGHAYRTLRLGESKGTSIADAYYVGDPSSGDKTSDRAVARVRSDMGENGITYEWDVLVTDPDKGSARVVAWGPAGSGDSLKPYMNAVSGDEAAALKAGEGQGERDVETQ